MKHKDLERNIKEQLFNHPTEVDSKALWNIIEPRLKRRRPAIVFWWLGGMIPVLLLGFWVSREYDDSERSKVKFENTHLVQGDSTLVNRIQSKHKQTKNETLLELEGAELIESNSFLSYPNSKRKIPLPEQMVQNKISPEPIVIEKLGKIYDENWLIIDSMKKSFPETFSTEINFGVNPIQQLALNLHPPARALDDFSIERVPDPTIQLALIFNAGVYNINRNYVIVEDSLDHLTYLKKRQETETTLEAISLEGLLQIQHRKGFYLKTGIQWTRLNEQLLLDTIINEIITDPNGIREIRIDQFGDTSFVTGTVSINKQIQYYKRKFNHYNLINIPLTVGHQINRNRWYLGLEGGLIFNLKLIGEGQITSPNDTFWTLSSDPVLRPRVDFGLRGELQFGYRVFPKTDFQLGVRYQAYPKSFTDERFLMLQNYNLIGLNLGIKQRF